MAAWQSRTLLPTHGNRDSFRRRFARDSPMDGDFETFLRRWTDERVWAVDDFLDLDDQQYMAERRALELIVLAKENGFREELTNLAKSHGSVLQYVKHLFFKASIDGRTGDSK
jgi:hypothetical protein